MTIGNTIVPAAMGFIVLFGLLHRVDVFSVFVEGAREGMDAAIHILPTLVALMTCVGMFKACGALDVIAHALSPAAALLQIPQEIVPLAVLRPISGSSSLVFFRDLLGTYGPDSPVGRIASVLEGSTETTLYIVAVYFGAAGVTRTRHALPAALFSDLVALVMSVVVVQRLFLQ